LGFTKKESKEGQEMRFNPPAPFRTSIYITSVFINAMVAAFVSSGLEVPLLLNAALAGFNAVVLVMAGANVTPDEQ
jgi:hypothetical protein